MTSNYFKSLQPICHEIWQSKYRFGNEVSQAATNSRVMNAICSFDSTELQLQTLDMMNARQFFPGGRILAGAGTGRSVTLQNCYVMGEIPDSLEGIFQILSESAMTMKMGGGIGMDFSNIRPKGAHVAGVDADASGPLSYMDVWDAMCKTIMSAGYRRGAMMATLRCDHPDVLDFIQAKQQPGRLTMFNISVLVTDAFMEAVRQDGLWRLGSFHQKHDDPQQGYIALEDGRHWYVYHTMRARDLWQLILKQTYDHAEPGVIFIDRINEQNNLSYCETISATNPCGEQPLPPYGNCCLGAINLAQFVINPFTRQAFVDKAELVRVVHLAVRFLDNVLDESTYPLEQLRQHAQQKRRIGLGVMGLATMFQQLGVRYGSRESVHVTEVVMSLIANAAYRSSALLARDRGVFDLYDKSKYLERPFIKRLAPETIELIQEHGIRNSVLLTVAPTGTTAIHAGNVSGGIEPVFAHRYTRKILQPDGSAAEQVVYDYGWLAYCEHHDIDPDAVMNTRTPIHATNSMLTAQDLTVDDHINVMAAAQKWVDASISKTVNCPAKMPFNEFEKVYMDAFEKGCKSCTTYRPNPDSGRGAVLSVEADEEIAEEDQLNVVTINEEGKTASVIPFKRPRKLAGFTYKIKPNDHAYYVTITNVDGKPCELFIQTKDAEHSDWTAALGRMISAIWRRGGDTDFVAEELRQIHAAAGGFWLDGKYVPSIVAAIGDLIAEHEPSDNEPGPTTRHGDTLKSLVKMGERCPSCQRPGLVHESGCKKCLSCGWSNCG